jgi:hypothetical protein
MRDAPITDPTLGAIDVDRSDSIRALDIASSENLAS